MRRKGLARIAVTLPVWALLFGWGCGEAVVQVQPSATGHRALTTAFRPPTNYQALDHCLLRKGDTYHFFYIKNDARVNNGDWNTDPNSDTIGHSTSPDLATWTHQPDVIPVVPGTWEQSNVWAPHVIEHQGLYYMYYTGVSYPPDQVGRNVQRIGLATSIDLFTWNKHPDNPIYDLEGATWARWNPGEIWQADCRDPMVWHDRPNQRWVMYFNANRASDGQQVVGMATSTDLITWQDAGYIPVTAGGKAESPTVTYHDPSYYLFWSSSTGIRYATAPDPLGPYTLVGLEPAPGGWANETPLLDDGYQYYTEIQTKSYLPIKRIRWLDAPVYEYVDLDQPLARHPSTLLTDTEIPSLRHKVKSGGESQRAFDKIIERAAGWVAAPGTMIGPGNDYGLKVIPQIGLAYWLSDPDDPSRASYLETCRQALLKLANDYDPDSGNPGLMTQTASRLNTLALGYDLCFGDADPADKATMHEEIALYLTDGWWADALGEPGRLAERGAREGVGLALAGMVLEGEELTPDQETLRQVSLNRGRPTIEAYLSDQFHDGVGGEGALYSAYVLTTAIPYMEALSNRGGERLWERFPLDQTVQWLLYLLHPDGNDTVRLNDVHSAAPMIGFLPWIAARYDIPMARYLQEQLIGTYGRYAELDSDTFNSRELLALFDTGAPIPDPNATEVRSRLFGEDGLYVFRSGWPTAVSSSDLLLTVTAGEFMGGHEHEDKGSFTLDALGERFLVDIGYVVPETERHNLVTVDGQGQQRAHAGCGNDGEVASFQGGDLIDLVTTDATAAYQQGSAYTWALELFSWCWSGWPTPRAFEFARRHFVVIKDETDPYLVLVDDLQKDASERTYTLNLQTPSTNGLEVGANPIAITAGDAQLSIYLARPAFVDLSLASDVQSYPIDGTQNIRRLQISTSAVNPRFLTVLYPHPTADAGPGFTTLTVDQGDGVRIDQGDRADSVYVSTGAVMTDHLLESDAALVVVREDPGPRRFAMEQGSYLRWQGRYLILASAEASVSCSGEVADLSDPEANYAILGPGITSVRAVDGPVPFIRQGDYVVVGEIDVPDAGVLDAGGDMGPAFDAQVVDRVHPDAGTVDDARVEDTPMRDRVADRATQTEAGEDVLVADTGRDALGPAPDRVSRDSPGGSDSGSSDLRPPDVLVAQDRERSDPGTATDRRSPDLAGPAVLVPDGCGCRLQAGSSNGTWLVCLPLVVLAILRRSCRRSSPR